MPLSRRSTHILAATVAAFALVAVLSVWHDERANATDQTFNINIGDTISNGVPSAGAGNIEATGDRDIYHFTTVSPNTMIWFEQISCSTCTLRWTLAAPSGPDVFANLFIGNQVGLKTLVPAGQYTLTVFDNTNTLTGTYSFKIHAVPAPETFPITLDQTVSDGVPSAGAGNIEALGSVDVYHFTTASPNTVVYVDSLACTACTARWTMTPPSGPDIFTNLFVQNEVGIKTLPVAGQYTITVYTDATSMVTGTYSFIIRTVPAPQVFSINIDDVVDTTTPGGGSGNLEAIGSKDIYHFTTSTPDTVVFVDSISCTGACLARWTLSSPGGGADIFSNLFVQNQVGVKTLPNVGQYTLTVVADPNSTVTGTYSFSIRSVPAPQVFSISLNEVVDTGNPGGGSGNIETYGSQDIYHFQGFAGAQVIFDNLSTTNTALRWVAVDSSDNIIKPDTLVGTDSSLINLTDDTYTITVASAANAHNFGTYSFRVFTTSPTPTRTSTLTPTITNTATPTTAATNTATNTPTNTSTPAPNTATNTPTNTPTSTATSTNTPTPTATVQGSTATNTPTSTPTNTNTPTATSTNTSTATATAVITSTNTPTATATQAGPTDTSTPVPTSTDTATSTATSVSPTGTSTPVDTATPTNTAVAADTATSTSVPADTATSTSVPADTATATPAPTDTATSVPTETATSVPTATPTSASTATSTTVPTSTSTSEPGATSTSTPVATASPGRTRTPQATRTAARTATVLPSRTAVRTAAASPSPGATGAVGCERADVNGDGRVNGWDVVFVAHALWHHSHDPRFDVNGDGNVNVRDLVAVAHCIRKEHRR